MSGIALGRRSRSVLAARLESAHRADLTYDKPGSTVRREPPTELPEREFVVEVEGDLDRARAALRAWAPHRGIRGRIIPPDAPLHVGTTLLVVAPFGPFELLAPDRIAEVIDEPDRFGFVYATLSGHPEVGEELFLAEVIGPNELRLTVRIHAGPGTWITRVGSPVVTWFQMKAARRYLQAWASAIEEES